MIQLAVSTRATISLFYSRSTSQAVRPPRGRTVREGWSPSRVQSCRSVAVAVVVSEARCMGSNSAANAPSARGNKKKRGAG